MDGGEPDIPVYKVIESIGPTNTRVYTVAVYFRGKRLASATGHSIQQAEMNAAKTALENSRDLFPQLDHQKRVILKSIKKQRGRDYQVGDAGDSNDQSNSPNGAQDMDDDESNLPKQYRTKQDISSDDLVTESDNNDSVIIESKKKSKKRKKKKRNRKLSEVSEISLQSVSNAELETPRKDIRKSLSSISDIDFDNDRNRNEEQKDYSHPNTSHKQSPKRSARSITEDISPEESIVDISPEQSAAESGEISS